MNTVKAKEGFDEPVTEAVLEKAIVRSKKLRSKGVHAAGVQYVGAKKSLEIKFLDQSAVLLPVKNYPELATLSETELNELAIGFGGTALCLESCDLHVSIAGLVSASHSLMEMAATLIAARNGSKNSASKVLAARQNGTKGGRPRHSAAAG